MVGILCSPKKEVRLANVLHEIFMADANKQEINVVVFSMLNMNLIDKTVYGSLISGEKVTTLKTDLPLLIFNFAVQHTKKDVKKLRNLMEIEDLTLLNLANSFNQWSIMKILSSGSQTKKYVMPYSTITRENISFDPEETGNFIIKPQNGSNLSKMIYGMKVKSGFDLFNWNGNPYSHLFDIENAILPTIRKGKWILSKAPDLITHDSGPLIIRGYLQRNTDGKWNILLRTSISQKERVYRRADGKINNSLLEIMNYINCFIVDLVFCSIDLVIGRDGTPYFLNLGGWQYLLPNKRQNKILFTSLCQNMMAYEEIFMNK